MGNIAFLVATALAGAYQPQPLVVVTTPKSIDAFGACFAKAQERARRAWAFTAADDGGSFTNEGANGVSTAYRLQVSRSGGVHQLKLFVDQRADNALLFKAIDQCR